MWRATKTRLARERPDAPASLQVIYVGNLPNSANETNLKEVFDTFSGGEVRLKPICNL